jgi:hypothetical protein
MKSKLNPLVVRCVAAATFLLIGGNIAAADRPFDGVWKLNMSKSKLTGETFSFEKKGAKIRFESHGYAYDLDLSGNEFPEPDGQTVSAREIDAHTWEITHRLKGKTTFVRQNSVSGDTLTSTVTMAKADGTQGNSQSTWKRVSGGPGFFGKWKSTEIKAPAISTLEITTGPNNSVTMSFPEMDWICRGNFNGKDHALTIAGVSSKMTMAFESHGQSAFKTTLKSSGKPEYIDAWTLSSDGMTLVDDGTPVSADEPTRLVFEKDAAADRPFDGIWKLNLSKSKLTGETMSFERAGDHMRVDQHGITTDFDLNGKEFATRSGGTVVGREIDPRTWELTHGKEGKTNRIVRMTLDRDTLTIRVRWIKPDGSELQGTGTWTRISGESGLLGKWKSTNINPAVLTTIEIRTGPNNAVTMGFPNMDAAYHAHFDGKDYQLTGSGATPTNRFCSFEHLGKDSFKATLKIDGKPNYIDRWTPFPGRQDSDR